MGRRRRRFSSSLEDSGFNRSQQIHEVHEASCRPPKRSRITSSHQLQFENCQSFRSDPYAQRRIQSPDLFDNSFSPGADNQRNFEELVEENQMLRCQLDEGAKQTKQEKANLKAKIAGLEKRCHGFDARVLELKKQKQKVEEKRKELVAENKSELENAKKELETIRKALHDGVREQQSKHTQAINEATTKSNKAQEEVEFLKKELISTQKQVIREQGVGKELELKCNKLCQRNETARVFQQLRQGEATDTAKNGAVALSPGSKTNVNKRLSDQDNARESLLCPSTMEKPQSAEATLSLEQKHARLKSMYSDMEGRLKHYEGLEAKLKESEEKVKYYQRLEESRSKEQEMFVKDAVRSKEQQVDLKRMCSEKQILSTKLAALEKDLEKNKNLLRDAQEKLQQYKDYFGNQLPSEVSAQYQELETKNKEVTGKLHDLEVQTADQCAHAENQVQSLESEIARLENGNKELENVTIILSEDNDRFSSRVADLVEQLDQKPKLDVLMQSTQLEMKTKELKEATDKCQSLQEQLAALQTKLEEHKSQLDVKIEETSELSELRIQNDNLHEKLTHWHQQFCGKNEQVAKQQQELDELRRKLGDIKTVVNSPKAPPEPNPTT